MFKDRGFCGLHIQPVQLAADGVVGINTAQNDIGVGHGGARVPLTIGDRAGRGPGAFRPDVQQAALIDPSDRATARADCRNLDHGGPDHHAEVDRRLLRQPVRCLAPQLWLGLQA